MRSHLVDGSPKKFDLQLHDAGVVEYTSDMDDLQKLKSDIQRIRQVQLEINKKIINGNFKIPIH